MAGLTHGRALGDGGGEDGRGEEGRVVVHILEVDLDVCVAAQLPVTSGYPQVPFGLTVRRVAVKRLWRRRRGGEVVDIVGGARGRDG